MMNFYYNIPREIMETHVCLFHQTIRLVSSTDKRECFQVAIQQQRSHKLTVGGVGGGAKSVRAREQSLAKQHPNYSVSVVSAMAPYHTISILILLVFATYSSGCVSYYVLACYSP